MWFPDSVGQFTGITDKNGIKVFEADVVKHKFSRCLVRTRACQSLYGMIISCVTICLTEMSYIRMWISQPLWSNLGNAYDNPELIKK